jgi:hypothetical protein
VPVLTTNNSGLWLATPPPGSGARLIAREGDQAPGLAAGVQFAIFNEPAINSAGRVAFTALLRGTGVTPTTNAALFASDSIGRVRPLVRTGDLFDVSGNGSDRRTVKTIQFDAAPGGPPTGQGQFNASGALAFKLVFVATPITTTNGVFTGAPASPADFNGDGAVNIQDFLAYLQAFAAGDAAADMTGDGQINIQDFLLYLSAFAAG